MALLSWTDGMRVGTGKRTPSCWVPCNLLALVLKGVRRSRGALPSFRKMYVLGLAAYALVGCVDLKKPWVGEIVGGADGTGGSVGPSVGGGGGIGLGGVGAGGNLVGGMAGVGQGGSASDGALDWAPFGTGGAADAASGGAGGVATGGTLVATGGISTGSGGVVFSTGGMATGGISTGGMATGGIATGGIATGGIATGGIMATGGTLALTGGTMGGTGGAGGGSSPDVANRDTSPPDTGTQTGLAAGLLVYYTCDQASGTSLPDLSGYGRNGTLASALTGGGAAYAFIPGHVGDALALSQNNEGYVSLPAGFLRSVKDVTVATWIMIRSNTNWQRIFDFSQKPSIYMHVATNNDVTSKLRFAISLTGGAAGSQEQIIDSSAGPLPAGPWNHVAVVLGAGGGTLYVDGVVVGTNPQMTLRPADLGVTTANYIGRSHGLPDPYLDGTIDEFRIYDRALSAAEIKALAAM